MAPVSSFEVLKSLIFKILPSIRTLRDLKSLWATCIHQKSIQTLQRARARVRTRLLRIHALERAGTRIHARARVRADLLRVEVLHSSTELHAEVKLVFHRQGVGVVFVEQVPERAP